MARVYLETSFVSACVTTRTDVRSLYRRDASREWWETQAAAHRLFVSVEVLAELSHPDYPQGPDALAWIEAVPLVDVDEEVRGFASILVRERVMPAPVAGDAFTSPPRVFTQWTMCCLGT